MYRQLGQHLDVEQPFYVLQEIGLHTGEPHHSINEMAEHYLRELREVQPHGPYTLGGHCFGGMVAFEMAHRLLAEGEEVELLALLESYGPAKPNRFHLGFRLGRLAKRTRKFSVWRKIHTAVLGLWRWGIEQGRGVLFRLLARAHAPVRWLRRIDSLAYYNMVTRQYTARRYPGRLVLFRSEGHPYFERDPLLWWGDMGEKIAVREIAGLHETFHTEPHVAVLAAQLTACLQQARERDGADSAHQPATVNHA